MPGQVSNVFHIHEAHGDTSIYNDSSRPEIPDQLPPEEHGFTNQSVAIARLSHSSPGPQRKAVVGLAGSGKSGLALHWANLDPDRFTDGRIHLDLRGEGGEALSTHQSLGSLLDALGTPEADQPSDTTVRAARWRSLSSKLDLLIILDNAADSAQVWPLLSTGARTVTIITSRDSLAELEMKAGVDVIRLEALETGHAVTLLRTLIEPRRGPCPDQELLELADLCGRLVLALRIAAQRLAKSPLLTVAELIAELREPGHRLDPVRAVFENSLGSLSPSAAHLFRLLGLAPGSQISREVAETLATGETSSAREALDELITSHLLAIRRPGWFQMHDLLHAYAAELSAADSHRVQSHRALERLGKWYARTAAKAARALKSGSSPVPGAHAPVSPEQDFTDAAAAQKWYSRESENLTLLTATLAEHGLEAEAVQLAAHAVDLYALNNAFDLWFQTARLGASLASARDDHGNCAWFEEFLGKAHLQAGDMDHALRHLSAALEIRRRNGDHAGETRSYNALGLLHYRGGDFLQAAEYFTRSLDSAQLAERGDTPDFSITARMNLGMALLQEANTTTINRAAAYEQALSTFDAALSASAPSSPGLYRVTSHRGRAEALAGLGRFAEARVAANDAITLARALGNKLSLAPALRSLAQVLAADGDLAPARETLTEAIEILRHLADPREQEYRSHLQALSPNS